MKLAWLMFYLVACVLLAGACVAAPLQRAQVNTQVSEQGLTQAQASELLLLVLQHQGTPLPPASAIEYLTQKDETDITSGFYAFGVTTDSAHAGASTNQGMFVVDKQTGDIWEFNVCRRYRFAQLLNAQKIVMQATGKRLGSARQVRAKLGCVAAHR